MSETLADVQLEGSTRAVFLVRATLAAGTAVGAGALFPFVSGALAAGCWVGCGSAWPAAPASSTSCARSRRWGNGARRWRLSTTG